MSRILALFLSLALSSGLWAQNDVKDKVALALKTGNSKELAQNFIANIDLTVLGTSDVFSKAQAEGILRKFFDEHAPNDLTIEHEGGSKMGDRYYIGTLKTTNGSFRVTFFLKNDGSVFRVRQLRIETSKGDY